MRLRPFAKAAAVALLVAALQPPASAALPQQTASDERNFDESVKAFQTSLAVLSTKPNDLFTFNVKGWTDNHNKMTGRLLDRSSVVWDDYRSLDADGMEQSTPAKKCELYALARNGVVVGHGLPYSKNAMQAALTQTNTLRAWLGGLEHEFETQLLEGQLSGKKAAGTAQLQARLQVVLDVLKVLDGDNRELSYRINEFSRMDDDTIQNMRDAGCPGYPKVATPMPQLPSASPKSSPPPLPKPSPPPSVVPAPSPSATSHSCPLGYRWYTGYGCVFVGSG